jgi:enamine deaminase RidA (YjgF/YER057c/UK114 family)
VLVILSEAKNPRILLDDAGRFFASPLRIQMTRTIIPGTSPYEAIIGFSRAVRIGNKVHVSGTGPVGADHGDIAQQTEQCLTIIATALKNAGSSIEHVYRTRMYLTHTHDWEVAGRIHGKFFSILRPAATMVVVKELLNPSWRIEIEADACIPD